MKFVLEQCDNGNFNKVPNFCNFGGKLSCFALQMVIHHFTAKNKQCIILTFFLPYIYDFMVGKSDYQGDSYFLQKHTNANTFKKFFSETGLTGCLVNSVTLNSV